MLNDGLVMLLLLLFASNVRLC